MRNIQPEIITVQKLLSISNIEIPPYQRPYKWKIKNVNQLIDDIIFFKHKPAYRLGTIVLHQDKTNNILNIVDGQQRTITLILIGLAIQNNKHLYNRLKKSKISTPKLDKVSSLCFQNSISKNNIRDNYYEIERRVSEFDEESVQFFYENCEVVKVMLTDISEAFQFFDSQNARGVDLFPHDLLKAFHLREMLENSTERERIETVNDWEEMEMEKLTKTFSNYLFRIRNWSNSKSARKFTKDDIDVFKGISFDDDDSYPFATLYRICHHFVENYNQDFSRKIDKNKISYPFQLDQNIINGKRFFEMIQHYVNIIDQIQINSNPDSIAYEILNTINDYDGKNRTGDKYVRNLFDCALIFYIDKFSNVNVERAIEKIFIWSYSLRLTMHSVQLASIDNHALSNPHIFKTIKDALHPREFLNIKLKPIETKNLKDSDKTNAIKELFIKMKFIYV